MSHHYSNRPSGDTTLTKVFVGGLAWETTSETLETHFKQYGEIREAVVIVDRESGRSRGYGFVTYVDPKSAIAATSNASPTIDNRDTNCVLAAKGNKKRGSRHRHYFRYHPRYFMNYYPDAGGHHQTWPPQYGISEYCHYMPAMISAAGAQYCFPTAAYMPTSFAGRQPTVFYPLYSGTANDNNSASSMPPATFNQPPLQITSSPVLQAEARLPKPSGAMTGPTRVWIPPNNGDGAEVVDNHVLTENGYTGTRSSQGKNKDESE